MAADPIRLAIHAALTGDSALEALVDQRIYIDVAPEDAALPFVVFHKQSGTPRWTFQGDPVEDQIWTVKGIATGSGSATKAEEIAAAIDAVLTDAELSISGRTTAYLRRESDLDFSEVSDGELYRHRGGLYRLFVS